MPTPLRPDLRAKEITLIHIAKDHLGLDETTYRAQIARISQGRTSSSADLTAQERDSLLAEYRRAGWVPTTAKRAGRGPTAAVMDRRVMLTKVNALLADQRLPWAYAEAILRRQRGITDAKVACPLEHTTDVELRGVIAALHRRGKRQPTTPPTAA
jgi:phage gp16-like protein